MKQKMVDSTLEAVYLKKESEHSKCVLLDRLEFACLAYIHSGKYTYHMCTNEERQSMSQEIYLRSTLV